MAQKIVTYSGETLKPYSEAPTAQASPSGSSGDQKIVTNSGKVLKPYTYRSSFFNDAESLERDANQFIRMANRDNSEGRYFNAADYFEERKKQGEALKRRAADLTQQMEADVSFDPESYQPLIDYLANFDTAVDDVLSMYQPSLESREGMRAYEDEFIAAQERNDQFKSLDRQALFGLDNTSPAYNLLESMMRYRNDESYRAVSDNWTDQERYTLGQLQKEDPTKARDYATQVNNYYNAKATEGARENIRQQAAANKGKNTAAALLASTFTAPGEMADRLAETMARGTTTEKNYVSPWEYAQEVTGAISEDLNQKYGTLNFDQYRQFRDLMDKDMINMSGDYTSGLGALDVASGLVEGKGMGDVYNLGYNVAQNTLNRFTLGALGGEAAVLGNYFMNAATSGIDEARKVGATGNQALWSGILKGASEVLTEKAPLDELFKMGPAVTWGDVFKLLAKQSTIEGLGEGINSILGYASDQLVLGDLSEYNRTVQEYIAQGATQQDAEYMAFRDVARSVGFEALSGMLSGIASGGGETVKNTLTANNAYRSVDPRTLIDAGLETEKGSKAHTQALQMQENLDNEQKISGNQKRVLAQNTQLQQLAQEKVEAEAAFAQDLEMMGETGDIQKLAAIAAKKSQGEDLNWREKRTVRNNQNVQTLLNTMTEESTDSASAEPVTTFSRATEQPQVSMDGRAVQISTKNPVDVLGFAEMNDKVATVKLSDTETAAYDDISWANEQQANQFYSVRTLPGLDTESANKLLHIIQEADAGQDAESVAGIQKSYNMGYYNQSESNLAKGDAAALTPELRKAVFDIGRQQNQVQEKIQPKAKAVTAKPTQGYKKITIEGKITKLDKKHKAEMAYVDSIADNFAGTAVHVYESYVGADGKRYFRDNNGVKHKAPNGKYINGEIWLDINSGDNGEGMMLNTFAHEMYHHIEKFNKEKANELASFVSRELGIENVEAAVQAQIDKARAAGYGEDYFKKQGMTDIQATNEVYARAMSDFVADSLETMFTRGNPAEAIAKLKTENRGLFDEIKSFIDKWVSKLKKFYQDKTISMEGEMVSQLKTFEELQQLFMEAMQGAGENYRAAPENAEPAVEPEFGDLTEAFSLRNEKPLTDREILAQIDPSKRNETERYFLGQYQNRLKEISEQEPRLEAIKKQMESLDPKKDKAKLSELRIEAGKIQRNVTYLKKKVRESEGFDMFKRMAKEERNNRSIQKYKEEQNQKIKDMQTEQRILRAQLKKTDDFASVMGEELAKLSKDYEAKKIDLKTMEDEYERLLREYESARKRVEQKKETQNVQKQRKYVEDHAKKLMKMLANPTKDAHVPMALQEPLKKFLDSIDFTSKRQASGGAATIKDRAYSKALRAVQEAVEGQRSAMTNEDGVFTLDVPPEFIDRIKEHVKMIEDAAEGLDTNTNRVYEMTSSELKDLDYILNTINKAIGMIDKFHMQGEKARTSGFSKETVQEMERRKPVKGEDGSRFIWNNYIPFHAFRAYGKAAQKIFTGLTEGQGKLARTVDSVIKFTEKTYTAKEVRGWERERHTIKLESGKTVTMSTAQIMTFWCLSHRDQAIPHMQGGGIRMTTLKKFIEGASVRQELVQKEHFTLTIADINRINNMLTDRQQEVARKLQQFMQTVGGRLVNEISMARWDYMAATEHDYFPIQTENVGRDAKNPDQERTSLFALLNKSFTKAPVKNSKNALIIDSIFNVFANHMSEVAEYNAFALPLVDAMKWFNYKERLDLGNGQIKDISVHGSIRDTLGKNAEKYFIDLMTDINSSQKAGRHEDLFGKILGRSKVASVAWNTRVAIQQISALPRASMILNAKSLMAGASKFRLKSATEEMMKYSGIALWKSMGYYDLNVARSVERQIKGDTSIVDKFNELGMWLPGKMDERTWARIWLAAKDQVRKSTNLTGEALLQSTAKLFEDVVYQTQVADSVLAKSSLMRSKSQLIKEATSFMAEPTLSLNNLMSAFQDYDETHTMSEKVKRGLMIGFTGYCLSAVANALLGSISDAGRDDDEFETFWEKYIQALLGEKFFDGNLFGELNPIEKIAFVKDILSVVKGNEPHSSYSKLLTGAVDLVNAYQNVAEGKGSKTVYGVVYQTLQYLSTTSGLALSNMTREVVDIWNNTLGKVNPELKLKRYKPDNAEELLTAIKKGTEEDFQRVFGRYESQEKAESALQSAIGEKYRAGEMSAEEATQLLTDYFDREEYEVYWILDKWDYAVENGTSEGYSKYGVFLDAIDNGGDYATEMQRYLEHGAEMSDIRSAISGRYKKQYLEADEAGREAIRNKLTPVFLETDMYQSDIDKKFNDWNFEAEYDYTYSAYKAAYRDGEVTEQDLRNAMKFYGLKNFEIDKEIRSLNEDIAFRKKYDMTLSEMKDAYDNGDVAKNTMKNALVYSGMTATEAQDWIKKRDISNRLGIDYMELDDAYKSGDITRQQLYNSMIGAGSTRLEADEAIAGYDWLKKNYKRYPDLTISDAKKFVIKIGNNDEDHTLADYGVTIDHYIQYAKLKPECKGVDANGDGKTDDGTLRDSIFRMIDSLPISDQEKDGLALISYGIKSIRRNAPWHKK